MSLAARAGAGALDRLGVARVRPRLRGNSSSPGASFRAWDRGGRDRSPALRHQAEICGALGQYVGRGLKDRHASGVWGGGENSRSRCRVSLVQVVGHRGPTPTDDLQDPVLDIAVEHDICREGVLGSGQGVGIRFPFVVLVTEDELPRAVRMTTSDPSISGPRGVSLRGLKNDHLSRRVDKVRQGDIGGVATRITMNVEPVLLGLDAFTLHLSLEQLVLDSSRQNRSREIELTQKFGAFILTALR